jgi:hypothetical protein
LFGSVEERRSPLISSESSIWSGSAVYSTPSMLSSPRAPDGSSSIKLGRRPAQPPGPLA